MDPPAMCDKRRFIGMLADISLKRLKGEDTTQGQEEEKELISLAKVVLDPNSDAPLAVLLLCTAGERQQTSSYMQRCGLLVNQRWSSRLFSVVCVPNCASLPVPMRRKLQSYRQRAAPIIDFDYLCLFLTLVTGIAPTRSHSFATGPDVCGTKSARTGLLGTATSLDAATPSQSALPLAGLGTPASASIASASMDVLKMIPHSMLQYALVGALTSPQHVHPMIGAMPAGTTIGVDLTSMAAGLSTSLHSIMSGSLLHMPQPLVLPAAHPFHALQMQPLMQMATDKDGRNVLQRQAAINAANFNHQETSAHQMQSVRSMHTMQEHCDTSGRPAGPLQSAQLKPLHPAQVHVMPHVQVMGALGPKQQQSQSVAPSQPAFPLKQHVQADLSHPDLVAESPKHGPDAIIRPLARRALPASLP